MESTRLCPARWRDGRCGLAVAAIVAACACAPLRAEGVPATPPIVTLAAELSSFAGALEKAMTDLAVVELRKADDGCTADGAEPTAEELKECREKIAAAWKATVTAALTKPLAEQEKAIRVAAEGSDDDALGRMNPTIDARSSAVRKAIAAAAEQASETNLKAPATGTELKEWISEETAKTVRTELAAAVRKAAETADKAVLAAFDEDPPDAAALLGQLAKAREQLLEAAGEPYSRSVTCTWISTGQAGKRLSCDKGLLLSGEEVSDILIEGLPRNASATVTALIAEQRSVAGQERARLQVTSRSPSAVEAEVVLRTQQSGGLEYGCPGTRAPGDALPRLDVQTCRFGANEALPVVIEVHTDRLFQPTHGGGPPWGGRGAEYWGNVALLLRDPQAHRMALVSKGQASRVFLAVKVDGVEDQTDVWPIPVGYARWKFEAAGFFGGSNVVDQDVRSRAHPTDNKLVIVDEIADIDEFGLETGVLANFVPQNYQVIGVALGFAANESRAPSTYLGVNLRVRTFGQKGLASIGAGWMIKSVTRFPGLEDSLDAERAIASDSSLLRGRNQFEDGFAAMVSLGFSFGPIAGPN